MNKKSTINKLLAGVISIIFIITALSSTVSIASSNTSFKNIYLNKIIDNVKINKEDFSLKTLMNKLRNYFTQDILGSKIYTNCNGVEKYTDANFGVFNNIDADDDPNTGDNGIDISIQYLLLPWIEFEPYLAIGFMVTISVERLGEEIKDKDLTVKMLVGENDLAVGYRSPEEAENEIPRLTRASLLLLFNPLDRTYGTKFILNPEYSTGLEDKVIEFYAEYKQDTIQRKFSLKFDPATKTEISIWSTKEDGKWNYMLSRQSAVDSELTASIVKIENSVEKETVFVIDSLPEEINFELMLTPLSSGGGQIFYESSRMYDVELLIKTDEIGTCRYAAVKNTPYKLTAEWLPTLENGFYKLSIDSEGTDIILKDSITDPVINLTIRNLDNINVTSFWNLTNPGDFILKRKSGLSIDLTFILNEWIISVNAEPEAETLSTAWDINTTGYIKIDTDWKPLTTVDLLIKGDELGLKTSGESFKANDFTLSWILWPPFASIDGQLEYKPFTLSIDLYLTDTWYHLWPIW